MLPNVLHCLPEHHIVHELEEVLLEIVLGLSSKLGLEFDAQASYGKGPDYFLLKIAIFPISVFLLLFSMKSHTELENDKNDSFQ